MNSTSGLQFTLASVLALASSALSQAALPLQGARLDATASYWQADLPPGRGDFPPLGTINGLTHGGVIAGSLHDGWALHPEQYRDHHILWTFRGKEFPVNQMQILQTFYLGNHFLAHFSLDFTTDPNPTLSSRFWPLTNLAFGGAVATVAQNEVSVSAPYGSDYRITFDPVTATGIRLHTFPNPGSQAQGNFVVTEVSFDIAPESFHWEQTASIATPGWGVEHILVEDFTGDGKGDLFIATGGWPGVGRLLPGNGDGTFGSARQIVDTSSGLGAYIGAVTAADMDNDGDLDIVVASGDRGSGFGWGSFVLLFRNDGSGNFVRAGYSFCYGGEPRAIAAHDVNGDGFRDVWSLNENGWNYTTSRAGLALIMNVGGTLDRSSIDHTEVLRPSGLAVADFDEDGTLDIAVTRTADNSVAVRANLSSSMPVLGPASAIASGFLLPGQHAAGDLDGDGHEDLVFACRGTVGLSSVVVPDDSVWWLRGHGDLTFDPPARLAGLTGDPEKVVLSDLDNDGDIDIIVLTRGIVTRGVALFRNEGGLFVDAGMAAGRLDPRALVVADIDGDSVRDLVIGSAGGGDEGVVVLRQQHARLFQSAPIVLGRSAQLELYSPTDAGRLCVFALALGSSPGTPWIDGRTIPLNSDAILSISLQMADTTRGMSVLGASGRHHPTIPIPADPSWLGVNLDAAFVSIDPGLPTLIRTISPPLRLRIDAPAGVRSDHAPPQISMVERTLVSASAPMPTLRVHGDNFAAHPGMQVMAGGQPVSSFRRVSDHLIEFVPAGLGLGWNSVDVITPSGTASLQQAYYVAWKARVSAKFMSDAIGDHTRFWTNYSILRSIDECNQLTLNMNRLVWYELEEVATIDQPQWWITHLNSASTFEAQARSQSIPYAWRFNAINFYMPGICGPSWGYGLFPSGGDHIMLASDCWGCPERPGTFIDHELGHYFGLRHTFDPLEAFTDTPLDPWDVNLDVNANIQALSNLYWGSPSYSVLWNNLMGYYSGASHHPVATTTLTPQQIIAWRSGLLAQRGHVVY
ncbi:MAG: FG-GAP-like repeat-containing protein [Planctomycetota bacterium]